MIIRVETRVAGKSKVGKDNRGKNKPIKGKIYYYCLKGNGRRGVEGIM